MVPRVKKEPVISVTFSLSEDKSEIIEVEEEIYCDGQHRDKSHNNTLKPQNIFLKELVVKIERYDFVCEDARINTCSLTTAVATKNSDKGKPTTPTKKKRQPAQDHHCSVCGYQTRESSRFRRHLEIHSDDRKTFSCHKCAFCTYYKQKLDLHIRGQHDGYKIKRERCKKCAYRTYRKNGLKNHVCQFGVFICYDCGFTTNTKTRLRNHMRIHRFDYK